MTVPVKVNWGFSFLCRCVFEVPVPVTVPACVFPGAGTRLYCQERLVSTGGYRTGCRLSGSAYGTG